MGVTSLTGGERIVVEPECGFDAARQTLSWEQYAAYTVARMLVHKARAPVVYISESYNVATYVFVV
jgi:hypothetical protein